MGSVGRSLEDVLAAAQRAGILGSRPIDEVIEHASHFTRAIPDGTSSVIDIGSGAGVPGLVIAVQRPELAVTMVDRRATRMDVLRRSVSALALGERVRVVTADASVLGHSPDFRHHFDVAVSRGLGAPAYTAKLARPFLIVGGSLIVSEPPDSGVSRWPEDVISATGFADPERHGAVVRLTAIPV